MDKTLFYRLLNIDNPEDYQYFENTSALFEADDYIETNLIKDLLKDINLSFFAETTENYFEDFLKNISDDENELYITVDSINRSILGLINEDMSNEELSSLADEIARFRKWYVTDKLVIDKSNGKELSVRDARYNTQASKYIGGECDYDYRLAYDYEIEGYNIKISDILES